MKIALLDLNHTTKGVHTNTAPLGIGLIARYALLNVSPDLDIRLFKLPDLALTAFKSWLPDVLGIAQYSWNSELNLHFARLVKKYNPTCLVAAGGPNFDYSESERIKFFKEHPYIDICAAYDGEIPFAEIIRRLLNGENKDSLRHNPAVGTYSFNSDLGQIAASLEAPPRLFSLDVFGAIYADGFFDEFLDQGFHPFLQTHRGCPFTCAFCHTSDSYYSRMLFLSPEIFRKDMEYLGRRFSGRHDVTLYLANTNMSLFKEDFAIAQIIKETQIKYDWPKIINVNSGKDPKKLMAMMSIIDFQPGIALQTLTPAVLENIKRKNIPFADFINFQKEILKKQGQTSSTELILCLPGETKASFLQTLKTVINSGVQDICVYTLMMLKGTPLSSPEYARRYKYLVRHRVVPRQFSLIQGEKILDAEEVIVGTDTMPFSDYLELRGLCFIITAFFSSTELIPLKRLLLEYEVDMADWIFNIHARIKEETELYPSYEAFIQETKNELFASRQDLLDYFNKKENFSALQAGKLGDNLLRKYKCLVIADHFMPFLNLAGGEALKLLTQKLDQATAKSQVENLKAFLESRNVKAIFENTGLAINKTIHLNYDIPGWLGAGESDTRLDKFSGSFNYTVNFRHDIIKKAKNFITANKERDLSLQILYRDGTIREFWPEWKKIDYDKK